MLAPRLQPGDTIGLASPSWIATPEAYAPVVSALEGMGFRVKPANNLYANGWGYIASDRERADDINQLIHDDEVKLIFFSGGEAGEDVLPHVDFATAKAKPKLWLSFSDGTTLINAVWAKTGLITYYGQSPTEMAKNPTEYALSQFGSHIMQGSVTKHTPATPWYTLTPGAATGTLVGGFLDNFVFLANNGWVTPQPDERYVLIIEDNIMFWPIEHESALLARLELSPIMNQVGGLLFGHFSTPVNEQLFQRLTILGKRWNIPVAYCDDFGHGEYQAIFPIGSQVRLDTTAKELWYL